MTKTKIPTLETQPREKTGTRYAKRDRDAGRVPAVVYGHKLGAVHVSVDKRELSDLIHGDSHLVDVKVGGKSEHALVKALQWDTFGVDVIHVDFERVDMSEEVELEVELTLIGEPAAMRQAGVALDQPTTAVKIRCRADSIPSHLEHDIAELEVDVVVSIADLVMPAGVEAVSPAEQVVCKIAAVKVKAVLPEDEVDGEGGEEPAVIGEGAGEGEAAEASE